MKTWIKLNAMDEKEAKERALAHSGDIDFREYRETPPQDIQIQDTSNTGPGAFNILLVREGIRNDQGNEVDAEVSIEKVLRDKILFHVRPHIRNEEQFETWVKSKTMKENLSKTLIMSNREGNRKRI